MTRPPRAGHAIALLAAGLLAPVAVAQTPSPPSTGPDCRVVIDFQEGTVGEFPAGWQPRDDAARATYRVVAEGGLRFVRATAEGTGSQMGREFPWDANALPLLSWRWRPRVFPQNSDERDSSRSDSPLSVYAVFGKSSMSTRAVKYVWSRVAPIGTVLSSRARGIVLRSGPPPDEGWVTETVSPRQDYERLYGEAPASARGVAVLTDADQTRSRAVGDYGPFQVCPDRRP